MSALDSSFVQEKESPTRAKRHSLCQQLQQFQDKFQNNNLDISKPETQSEDCNDNSFISPNKNNVLEDQPELEGANQSLQASVEKDLHNESPKTITLIEDQLASRESMSVSSKVSQYNDTVDNESFAAFLSIKDTSYNTLVKSFQVLFENVSLLFKQRIKNLSDTYLGFLKVKCTQEKSYSSVNLGHIQNSKNHVIYIDYKSITDQIRTRIQSERRRKASYAKNLQQISTKLQKYIQAVLIETQSKISKIKQTHAKIIQVSNEMTSLMIPQNRKMKKKQINAQIYSSSFIRTKYLMGRERLYLSLIANFLEKILTFISYICLDIEPKNCLTIKQCLMSYVEASSYYSQQNKATLQKKVNILSRTHCYQQIYKEVAKMLELCVPESILPHNHLNGPRQYGEKLLKKIIEGLISQSQSLVYLPVIQLEPKDYVYHSKNKANVKWIKINHQSKYNSEAIEDHETYVILTMEGHLILQLIGRGVNESEQKMAILKLSDIKLSRKGNQIYLTDRGKGMIGYLFSSNAILGSLVFTPLSNSGVKQLEENPDAIITEFVCRAKQILECKKENNNTKNKN